MLKSSFHVVSFRFLMKILPLNISSCLHLICQLFWNQFQFEFFSFQLEIPFSKFK